MREEKQLTKAAGIISMATLLSRILGFIRDMILARLFGATLAADAFLLPTEFPIC